jgi:23S rRNA (adenine2503-C2)-methyltransferase
VSDPAIIATEATGSAADRANLFALSRAALEQLFVDHGEKAFHARQVMKWIYHRGVLDIDAMTDLSKRQRAWLAEIAVLALPEVV